MSDKALSLVSPGNALAIDPRRVALAADPFEPQSFAELYKFAETVSRTAFCPKEFQGKPDDCFVAMLHGKGLGLSALQSLQGVGVINGKPATYGETFWAVIISHPDFVDCEEDASADRAQVVMTRRNRKPYTATFSMQDAATANLKGKPGPWTNYPQGQMLWRARHRAATALFADALKGVLPREIAMDFIDGEIVPPTPRTAALPAESTAGQAPAAKQGDQPKPDEDPLITTAQVKEWNSAWNKALDSHKLTKAEALEVKRSECESYGASKSGELRVSHLNESLKRAEEWSPVANPTTESGQTRKSESSNASDATAQDASPAANEPIDPAEELARQWMSGLSYGPLAVDTAIKRHTIEGRVRWDRLLIELEPKAREAGLAEEGNEGQD